MNSPPPKRRTSSGGTGHAESFRSKRLRSDSIMAVPGMEGNQLPEAYSHTGKCIGVFTSGGDCSGNNNTLILFSSLSIYDYNRTAGIYMTSYMMS